MNVYAVVAARQNRVGGAVVDVGAERRVETDIPVTGAIRC